MSCHSLSSPGVQLPAGTERPCPHPWWHQPGDQSSGRCSLWEAEGWQWPERVLLCEELTRPQHHQRRDRPHHHLPLQRVRQVGRLGPGTGSKCVMNKAPVGSGPGWSEMPPGRKRTQTLQLFLVPSSGLAWYLVAGGPCLRLRIWSFWCPKP